MGTKEIFTAIKTLESLKGFTEEYAKESEYNNAIDLAVSSLLDKVREI